MSLFVLDTSALLTHWFREPGHAVVHDLLGSEDVRIAPPTQLEFLVRSIGGRRSSVTC